MSRIEQMISDIESYIDNCKFQPLSNTKIIVNKEQLEDMLNELRLKTPEEVKKYQKILNNKDAIIADAKEQAETIVNAAQIRTEELINEHEIMQKAYAEANRVVEDAQTQAQAIIDQAVNEANGIRQASINYTDDMLNSLQTIITHSMEGAQSRFDAFISSMQSSYDIVTNNRKELSGGLVQQEPEAQAAPQEEKKEEA